MTYYELDVTKKYRLRMDLERYINEYHWNLGLVKRLLWWRYRVQISSREIRYLIKHKIE